MGGNPLKYIDQLGLESSAKSYGYPGPFDIFFPNTSTNKRFTNNVFRYFNKRVDDDYDINNPLDPEDLQCTVGDPADYQLPNKPPSEDCWGTTQIILASCNNLPPGRAAICRVAAWTFFTACTVSGGGPGGPNDPNPNF